MIRRQDQDDIAVLDLGDSGALALLDPAYLRQLQEQVAAVGQDPRITGLVITGFQDQECRSETPADHLSGLENADSAKEMARSAQAALGQIARLPKPVICALDGPATGGAAQLAHSCHARLAAKGLRALVGQPEPFLGVIPWGGATQMLPRIIGIPMAAAFLRTGRAFSSAEAVALKYVDREVEGDLIEEAVRHARDSAAGEMEVRALETGPLPDVPKKLPIALIGHLSRAVDEILCRAVLEGARADFVEGLDIESRHFAEVIDLSDWRIGLENFRKNGLNSEAKFIHR